MRRQWVSEAARAALLALLVVAAVAGPAGAASVDFDCDDFGFQEDAQAVLDHDPTDRHNLDPNGDGWACTSLPSRSGAAEPDPAPAAQPPRPPVPDPPASVEDPVVEPEPSAPPRSVEEPSNQPDPRRNEAGRASTLDGAIRQSVGEVNRYWRQVAANNGWRYRIPGIVRFQDGTASACGYQPSFTGPFYCVLDATVYLDEQFLAVLFDVSGDGGVRLAVAHEYAHHVQQTIGVRASVLPVAEGMVFTIQAELHADCSAGAFMEWEEGRGRTDPLDALDAALTAGALGDSDDVSLFDPQAHGTPDMRFAAVDHGYSTGNPQACTDRYVEGT